MFLLVSVRHVGAHPDEFQHGVSIQSSINLGKTFPRISRIRIIPSTQILARVFVYLPPFISKILDFICLMVLIFILIYFEWRDTENQQYAKIRTVLQPNTVTADMERLKPIQPGEDHRFCDLVNLVRGSFNILKELKRPQDIDNTQVISLIERILTRGDLKIWARHINSQKL